MSKLKSFLEKAKVLYPKILRSAEPQDSGLEKPCLIWGGGYIKDTPVIMLSNMNVQVRKIMYCIAHNKEWVKNTRVIPQCSNGVYGCVEPSHMEYHIPIKTAKHNPQNIRFIIKEALGCKKNWYYFNDIFSKYGVWDRKNHCKIWKGTATKKGIPYIVINGKQIHLVQWVYALNHKLDEPNDEIKGLVRHTCGITLCINPRHLKLITKEEEKDVSSEHL